MKAINDKTTFNYEDIDDFNDAAKVFSEGDENLERFLLNCFNHDIKTIACCKGHKKEGKMPYISFHDLDYNRNYFYYMISKIIKSKKIAICLCNNCFHKSIIIYDFYNRQEDSKIWNKLNNTINNYNKRINYFESLPSYIKDMFGMAKLCNDNEYCITIFKETNKYTINILNTNEMESILDISNFDAYVDNGLTYAYVKQVKYENNITSELEKVLNNSNSRKRIKKLI